MATPNIVPPGNVSVLPGRLPLRAIDTPAMQNYMAPAPTPQVAPNLPPSPTRTVVSAPAPTPYGTFTAPDPNAVASDPYYQFRLSEGLKQQQRGAAARGTLLTGAFQKALLGYGQGLASEEGANIYDRALRSYTTNRDTNAQNFGQGMQSYTGSLAGSDRTYGAARDAYGDARDAAVNTAAVTNANTSAMDDYRRYVEAQQAAQSLQPQSPNPLGRGRGFYGQLPSRTFGG
ncbi:MAG TPA: hypothetical protein VGJ78_04400 [Vicinamibacterales bacterium]|jgi:hypothetical protein